MDGESQSLPYSTARKLDQLCDEFEAAFDQGRQSAIEEYLKGVTGPERDALLEALLAVEIELLAGRGPVPELDQYRQRFPENEELVSHAYREGLARANFRGAKGASVAGEATPRPDNPETVSMRESAGSTSHGPPQHHAGDAELDLCPEFGRFRDLKVLGKGGFGFVYRAYDPDLERLVALKVPRMDTAASPEQIDRFLREARSAATLRHPNICPVHEIGKQDGRPYIVMGFIEGKPLSAYIHPNKPHTERQAALLVRKVALALEAAHQKGIIHRDLKPHNIMIDRERRQPVVMDFGLARRETSDDSHLTQSGQIMGTPKYMPPEQAKGDQQSIAAASDIYSLGVILFELLCGRCPFTGSVAEVLGAVLHTEPAPPSAYRPGLDPRLEAICLKMMAKRIEDRHDSMQEVADALQEWLKRPTASPEAAPGSSSASGVGATGVERKSIEQKSGVTEKPGFLSAPSAGQSEPVPRRRRRQLYSPAAVWGSVAAGAALVLLGIVIIIRSPDGTETRIETDSDQATFKIDGDQIEIDTGEAPKARATGQFSEEADAIVEKTSYALHFDSPDSRVNLPVTYDGSHPITLETVVQFDKAADNLRRALWILGTEHGASIRDGMGIIGLRLGPDGEVGAIFRDEKGRGVGGRSGQPVPLGRFIHLAVVFCGEEIRVFVDGVTRFGSPATSTHRSTDAVPFSIGNLSPPGSSPSRMRMGMSSSFYGWVRMVRISNVARYTRNFVPPERFEPDEHTMALYLFEEGEGIALRDSSGNDHHGRIIGARWMELGDVGTPIIPAEIPDDSTPSTPHDVAAPESPVARAPDDRSVPPSLQPGLPVGPSPFDALRREDIDPYELKAASMGHPEQAPEELVAILGNSRLKHWRVVHSLAFAPGGELLASGSNDHTVKLWNAVTGDELHTLAGHEGQVHCVAFSPDGGILASGSVDHTIKLWEPRTGEELRTLVGHTGRVHSVAFRPDGQMLASGGSGLNNDLKLWDPETGDEVRTLAGHRGMVGAVAFSPGGKILASGSFDRSVKLWNPDTGEQVRTLSGHKNPVDSVAFSFDGRLLASTDSAGRAPDAKFTLKIWDVETGDERHSFSRTWGSVHTITFSLDDQRLVGGSTDGTVKLWDPMTGEERRTLMGHTGSVLSVAASPDGERLASGDDFGSIRLWNQDTSEDQTPLASDHGAVTSVALSPDGATIASSSRDRAVILRNADSGKQQRRLDVPLGTTVHAVAFSPDGAILASGSSDRSVKLWDPVTGEELRTLAGHDGSIFALAFQSNDRMIATGSGDRCIKLWDPVTGEELRTLAGHDGSIFALAFHPDGHMLASGSYDNSVKFWDPETGDALHTLTGHAQPVHAVAFSPDGRILASASNDKTVKLWNADSGKPLRTLTGHQDGVYSVDFRFDGRVLASSATDGSVRLWDPNTGSLVRTIQLGPTGARINQVVFTADGRHLVTANENGTVSVLRLSDDASAR